MATPADQLNFRTATKARIRRATREAQERLLELDERAERELLRIYRQAADDVEAQIRAAAGENNLVREERLQGLRDQVRQRIQALSAERGELFSAQLAEAAQDGTTPWTGIVAAELAAISDQAVQFVQRFVGEDGLQLSDRIWRLDRGAREAIRRQLEIAVVEGHGASRAAQDLLRQGEPVPDELQGRMDGARADNVAPRAAGALVQGDRSPYDNARRVFRTELGRAHNAAFEMAAFEHPDTIGTRFELSPRHPRPDICDMHASVNRHGLGAGVYPRGRNPYPAHPNTLSFITPVFADEVTAEDEQNAEEPLDWIARQPAEAQARVLGGAAKRRAFVRGYIGQNELRTPWRVIRRRLEQRGVDISELEPPA